MLGIRQEVTMDKNELRKQLYEKRKAIVQEHPEVLVGLQESISAWLRQRDFSCAGFYRPFRHEPDITQVLCAWAKTCGGQLAVPRVDDAAGGLMHFCLWSEDMPTVKGAFGIEEPENDILVRPDIIFSPCVGINRTGYRLGNGGGFFDRYLSAGRLLPKPPVTVAVAFDELITDENYQQSHDIAFDWIVTQSGFVSTKSRQA
ncbi:MAG: 5-formyltetrahydrofolate cyclo-ligase [Sutterellaceae bacterium]|nr:5-formyltetrahydrofolate cyclo-ligase [Sutterellaceae bacterium]